MRLDFMLTFLRILLALWCATADAQTIRYIGSEKLPASVGIKPCGLCQPPNGNWLTSPKNGNFELVEFASGKVIKNWGSINADNRLDMAGRQLAQVRGMCFESDGSVLVTFGSFYNANHLNLPVVCRVRFTEPLTIEGPWYTPDCETTKGNLIPADCAMRTLTGKPYLMFGSRGSKAEFQSFGLGLQAVGDFASDSSMVAAESLIHWPQRTTTIQPSESGLPTPLTFGWSDFPRDPSDGPTIHMIGQVGTVLNTYGQCDGVRQVVDIGESFLFVGTAALGRTWYGLKTDYQTWPSALDPSKPCMGVNNPHGLQAEGYRAKYWIIRKRDVFAGVPYTSVGNLRDLGGNVTLQSAEMSGATVSGNRLSMIDPSPGNGAAVLHTWEVGE